LIVGHCLDGLRSLPDESVDCVVTSPPYWGLRDYSDPGQEWPEIAYAPMPGYEVTISAMVAPLGQEPEPAQYIGHLVLVFREVRRVLKSKGTLWLNLGDSYFQSGGARSYGSYDGATGRGPGTGKLRILPRGMKSKDLCGIPWLAALALRSDGWYLRNDVIWSKPNPMPSSVTDRLTNAHEYMFLLAKASQYFYDADAVREPRADERNGASGARSMSYAEAIGSRDLDSFQRGTGTLATGPKTHGRNKRDVWTVASQPFTGWTRTYRQVRVERDAPCGGKMRKASPDCPVHADRPGQAPMAEHDAHAGDDQSRSAYNGDHREVTRSPGCAPTDQRHELRSGLRNADSPISCNSSTAIPHSSESHKTDRDSDSTLPCKFCGRIPSYIGSRRESPGCAAPGPRTPCCNSEVLDLVVHNQTGMTDCTIGTDTDVSLQACTCQYYIEKAEKARHFATMPPALVEPAIKAGCPVGGVVLDPFFGSGTVAEVAESLGRRWIGTEQSDTYAVLAIERVTGARERRTSVKTRKAPKLRRIWVEDWPSAVTDEARFWAEVHDVAQAEGEDVTAPTWTLAECRPYVPVEIEHVAESLYGAVYAAERARLSARAHKPRAAAGA
jgi:DNA modification methylase